MSLDKVIKYSVPLFVLAIVSRSIEEISFIYYAVPVLCAFFIVLLFVSSKSNRSKDQNGDPSTQFTLSNGEGLKMIKHSGDTSTPLSVTENKEHDIRHLPASRQGPVSGIQYLVFIFPGLWFLMTSLWSSFPEISAVRALYFILISLGSISAGILWIRYSEKNIFNFLLPANVIVVLLCLFSLRTGIPSDSWTAGHGKGFIGFFGHQNLLASVLLFTLPSVLFKLLQPVKSDQLSVFRNTRLQKTSNYLLLTTNYLPLTAYCLLLTANLMLLTLTYSRSALLALIFGVIVFLILNRNWKVLTYGFAITAVIIIAIYSIPSLNQAVDKIIKKDFPEVYSSRLWMWEPSYKAALEGRLFGLGYGISHPDIRSGEYSDRFVDGRIIREKGNSSLALVEETGVVGLVLFLLPILLIVILSVTKDLNQTRFFSRQDGIRMTTDLSPSTTHYSLLTTNYSLLTAALAAFLLHAQFEAWWVGVGSVQLPLFFLYIGLFFKQRTISSK